MKALILTGGKGTRLRPYTTVLPKPLMPVGEKPILEILLSQLKAAGVTEVILAVNYMYQLIEAMFKDGQRLGMSITYSLEDKPLGTAGPIANVLDQLGDNFMVLNGDLLTDVDFKALFARHLELKADATIGATRRDVKIDYGVLEINTDGFLKGYIEKPQYEYHVSMGINVFNRAAIAPFLKKGDPLDIPSLISRLIENKKRVYCMKTNGLWLDIGRRDDYELANKIYADDAESEVPAITKKSA